MTPLYLHNIQVETLFELLGNKENDMTKSLGWTLANSPSLRTEFAKQLSLDQGFSESVQIRLQHRSSQSGVTDIEVVDFENHHVIIEAKRGFSVPSREQLELYAQRMNENANRALSKFLVVLAESDREEHWLPLQIPEAVCGIPIIGISWREFQNMAKLGLVDANNAEKRLLTQLIEYLRKVTVVQNQYSNEVYVVPLAYWEFATDDTGNAITFVDFVEKYERYFHPIGNRFPYEPPNYIAFRYNGMLQSIHHIEHYLVVQDFADHFPLKDPKPVEQPHYLYTLGPPLNSKSIPTNDPSRKYPNIYGPGHNWCFIDLLLSCGSVSEAAAMSRERWEQV